MYLTIMHIPLPLTYDWRWECSATQWLNTAFWHMIAPHLPLRSCSHLLIAMRRDGFTNVPPESTMAEVSVIHYYLHSPLLHYKDQNIIQGYFCILIIWTLLTMIQEFKRSLQMTKWKKKKKRDLNIEITI